SCVGIYACDVGSQSRIDRVETAASRTISQRGAGAVPTRAGAHSRGPRRIPGQTKQIFDHILTANITTEPSSDRSLPFPEDIICKTKPRLPPLLVRTDSRSTQSELDRLVRGNQASVEIDTVVQTRYKVRNTVVFGVSLRKG